METALLLWKKAAGGKSKGNISTWVVHWEWSDAMGPASSGAPQTGQLHWPEFPTYMILWLLQQWNWLKRQTPMKTTSVFWFFPFLPWTDRRMDRKWRGKKRKKQIGKDLRDPFQRSVLVSSLRHLTERDIFILRNSGQYSGPIYFISLLRWVGELM